MKRRELRVKLPELKDWELVKLSDLYSQLGLSEKKVIVDTEIERRDGKIDGQIQMAV